MVPLRAACCIHVFTLSRAHAFTLSPTSHRLANQREAQRIAADCGDQ
jgi:hypothetical protein